MVEASTFSDIRLTDGGKVYYVGAIISLHDVMFEYLIFNRLNTKYLPQNCLLWNGRGEKAESCKYTFGWK
jgi:hypothetical protein